MRSADGSCARLGEAEKQHLPLLDQVFDRTSHIFDGHVGINPAPVVEIDAVVSKGLSAGLRIILT